MANQNIILISVIIVFFSSCDPSYSVIISNKSNIDRHINVIYPEEFKHLLKDSLTIYDNRIKRSKRYLQKTCKTPLLNIDTANKTYTFLLKSNFEAVIEGASLSARPTFGQIFIIDNKDSITFRRKDKTFKRSWFIGGSWAYRIKNSDPVFPSPR